MAAICTAPLPPPYQFMEKRPLGSLQTSVVGLGCNNFGWRIDAAATVKIVDAALEAGINFFDTADRYANGQSEEFLAAALGKRREQILIATKFGMNVGTGLEGAKPEYVRRAAEESLRRLRTDRIDLYQLHRPDPKTPIADTMGALQELVRAGKVREIGCSNFSVAQLREAKEAATGGVPFVSVQNEYSIFERAPEADGVLAECAREKMAFLPYFPLANGLLTGKYRADEKIPEGSRAADKFGPEIFTKENLAVVEELIAFAAQRHLTILELAYGYLLAQKVVSSVIAGASKPEQVRTNAQAGAARLSAGDVAEIRSIVERKPA